MSKFKVGDKVRVLGGSGLVYTVTETTYFGIGTNDGVCGRDKMFELVEPAPEPSPPMCCDTIWLGGERANITHACRKKKVDVERYVNLVIRKDKYRDGYYHELSCRRVK